jgi:hypothetical protein
MKSKHRLTDLLIQSVNQLICARFLGGIR